MALAIDALLAWQICMKHFLSIQFGGFFGVIFSFVLIFSCQPLKAEDLVLSLGQSKAVPFRGKNVWIQDRKIVSAQAQGGSLLLKGLSEGETLLQLDSLLKRIQVIHPQKLQLFEQFKKYTQRIPGLYLRMIEGQVVVDGHLYRSRDWRTLADMVKANPKVYQFRAKMSEENQNQLERHLNSILEKSGLRPQKFVLGDSLELRLPAKHPDLERMKSLLLPYGVIVTLDSTQIQSEPTIKTQITVVEIQKGKMMSWGVAWPNSMSAQVLPKLGSSSDPLDAQLNALETRGQGRVLASPNLICQSGGEAEFLAGGEFPIKFVNFKQSEVTWKKYGILLRVKPRADSSGRLSLKIETEVSNITEIVDGIPSLATNRVSTTFDLNGAKTIMLSGLLKEQSTNALTGLPWLSRIPVLGSLFSSRDYLEKRTELVIFVRPEIIRAEGEPSQEQAAKHLQGQGSLKKRDQTWN